MFDWCYKGQHSACPKEYKNWYHGTKKVKKKSVPAVIYTDEVKVCDCKCHGKVKR